MCHNNIVLNYLHLSSEQLRASIPAQLEKVRARLLDLDGSEVHAATYRSAMKDLEDRIASWIEVRRQEGADRKWFAFLHTLP